MVKKNLFICFAALPLMACGGLQTEPDEAAKETQTKSSTALPTCASLVEAEIASNPAIRDNRYLKHLDVKCENGYVTLNAPCFEEAKAWAGGEYNVGAMQYEQECREMVYEASQTAEHVDVVKSIQRTYEQSDVAANGTVEVNDSPADEKQPVVDNNIEQTSDWDEVNRLEPIASARAQSGNFEGAMAYAQSALVICERNLERDPSRVTWLKACGWWQDFAARAYKELDLIEEAETSFQSSLQLRERLVRERPDIPRLQAELATTFTGLGILQINKGALDEAHLTFLSALEIRENLAETMPTDATAQNELYETYAWMARVEEERGNSIEAIGYYEKSISVGEKILNMESIDDSEKADLPWQLLSMQSKISAFHEQSLSAE